MSRLIVYSPVSLAFLLLVFWFGQRKMIYLPSGDVLSPAEAGLRRAELVSFPTEDGLTLSGWFVPPATPGDGTTVIVFNGNAGNRSYRADLAMRMAEAGWAVLLFDYRGYGGNPGSPSEQGLAVDARAARRYADSRRDVDPRRVVYFGESLGGGVAVRLALERRPRALVLRSPWTSLVDTARHHFPYLPVRWLIRDRYPSIDLIARLQCPVLVVAASDDSIVPTSQSRRLFEFAPEPKQLVIVERADHNDEALVAGPRVIEAVAAFLRANE
jgi:fermentation-respiration switch protein FrsA (DUF1100 family)